VGITDPTLLLDLRDFNLLIALAPKREMSETQEFSPELLRKTEKRASFSGKMTGANKNLTMEDMEREVLLVRPSILPLSLSSPLLLSVLNALLPSQRFNPKFVAPMRYPTESDFSQDKVYSSSRLSAEEIPLSNEEVLLSEETPLANANGGTGTGSATETPIPTTAAVVPQTATTIPAAQASVVRKEGSSSSSSSSKRDRDREKRTPSFFSRSYIAWKNIANRGVYTPVCSLSSPQPSAVSHSCCC
jgi:hypothetical protein